MKEKQVVLIRKQSTPFKVNYPIDGRIKPYVWNGTKGNILNKKAVPFEVYEWLAQYTTTFQEGCLIIEDAGDEEIKEVKENIENADLAEKAVLTEGEVKKILNNGNHLVLKSKLDNLIKDLPEEIVNNLKRYIVSIAREVGIDSSAKRKVLCNWANLNQENSDLLFDKTVLDSYDEEE